MDPKYFLSDNPKTLANAIKQAVNSDRAASYKNKMRQGVRYYKYKHDILKFRLFYVDNEGKVHEETSRSNIKIPHAYLTELIDQKAQYLLSNPIEVTTEQKGLQNYLDQYIDEDFQLMLQEAVEGASQKGYEFVYTKLGADRLSFSVADSLKVIEIYDADNKLISIIRYYDTDVYKDGKTVRVTRSELWDKEKVWYFVSEGDYMQTFKLDPNVQVNPLYHDTRIDPETEEAFGRSIGAALGKSDFIPFLRLDKEGIYKFGMGFDSSQVGDGNVTNVVIQSRYTLLDLKCNKMEVRLRKLVKQMLELIVADINDRHGKTYDASDIEITITRDTMIDETEVETREKTKAERKQIELDTILDAAARLDDDTVLKAICDLLEIDYEEIQQRVEEQDYTEPTSKEGEDDDE